MEIPGRRCDDDPCWVDVRAPGGRPTGRRPVADEEDDSCGDPWGICDDRNVGPGITGEDMGNPDWCCAKGRSPWLDHDELAGAGVGVDQLLLLLLLLFLELFCKV